MAEKGALSVAPTASTVLIVTVFGLKRSFPCILVPFSLNPLHFGLPAGSSRNGLGHDNRFQIDGWDVQLQSRWVSGSVDREIHGYTDRQVQVKLSVRT